MNVLASDLYRMFSGSCLDSLGLNRFWWSDSSPKFIYVLETFIGVRKGVSREEWV